MEWKRQLRLEIKHGRFSRDCSRKDRAVRAARALWLTQPIADRQVPRPDRGAWRDSLENGHRARFCLHNQAWSCLATLSEDGRCGKQLSLPQPPIPTVTGTCAISAHKPDGDAFFCRILKKYVKQRRSSE